MGVYRRGNIWYIRYSEAGRLIRKHSSTQKRLAEMELAEIKSKQARGIYRIPDDNITLQVLIDAFLKYAKTKKTIRGIETDINHFARLTEFINPDKRLKQLSTRLFEDYRQYRISKGKKPATINREFNTYKSMFSRAVEWNYIAENPLKHIKPYTVPKSSPKFLSSEQIQAVLAVCADEERQIFLFFLHTGMRRSEVLNLKWKDVDLKTGKITVAAETSKSLRARAIPINDTLLAVLKELKKKNEYVFPAIRYPRTLWNIIHGVYKKARVEGYGIHSLRHTFASHLVMSGVDIVTVSELLGHAKIQTTMVYSHLSKEHLKQAVDKLKF